MVFNSWYGCACRAGGSVGSDILYYDDNEGYLCRVYNACVLYISVNVCLVVG